MTLFSHSEINTGRQAAVEVAKFLAGVNPLRKLL